METTIESRNDSDKQHFVLFVNGMSHKSGHAIENMRRICDTYFSENFNLEIVDISYDKQMAVDHQIIALPTLIRLNPQPKRILIGDLSNTQKVLKILDIES